jgi:Asp-tRNA(Asn)/Glu-tRNA(Gln) amidotransferase A subunit family amidase
MKVVNNENIFKGNHDPYNKIIPFNDNIYKQYQTNKNLRIGYVKSLEFIESTKASQRAVQETMNILTKMGHTMVPIEIPN